MDVIPKNDFGPQPLDCLLSSLELSNNDLVNASTQQLTHKVVAKGRKGRRLTLNAQNKILTALKAARPEKSFTLKDLFNY